jgi:hypothetical protein
MKVDVLLIRKRKKEKKKGGYVLLMKAINIVQLMETSKEGK